MSYTEAKKAYEALEINVEAVLEKLKTVPVSLHCWQGDDVRGFDTDPSKPLTRPPAIIPAARERRRS